MLTGNLFKYWTYQVFAPGKVLKDKYTAFKSLLSHDKRAHELMAELEEIYYQQQKRDFSTVERLCVTLSEHVAGIVGEMARICPGDHPDLLSFFKKIDAYIRFMAVPQIPVTTPPYVIDLAETGPSDLHLVGGKAINLGIVTNTLGLPVPQGFVITTNAYHRFIEYNGLRDLIDDRLSAIDIDNTGLLDTLSDEIRQTILAATVPPVIETAINSHYHAISPSGIESPGMAMRSSAVGEDSRASFAGQYATILNVKKDSLSKAYKEVIAGKYTPEALHYRITYGLSDGETTMAALVLTMIEARTSGVMYTADIANTKSGNMKIHAVWGLGELLVSGQSPADVLTLSKKPSPGLIEKLPAAKGHQMVCAEDGHLETERLQAKQSAALSLEASEAIQLAEWGLALENHFQQPQDIEWAIDGSGKMFLLQTRPLKTGTVKEDAALDCDFDDIDEELLLKGGENASSGIATGAVHNLATETDLNTVPHQAVLVARNALPHYAKLITRVNAIVIDAGSSAGHLASVAREFKVPALVNTGKASTVLTHGRQVTVHADGLNVYAGAVQQMLESPCAKIDLMADSPFMRKLRYIMKFVSTLDLVDPEAASFNPRHCRSIHDIIRYSHEKAIREMFHISDNRLRKLGFAKKLATHIPMQFYVLDVGNGLNDGTESHKNISIEDVRNQAMRALWAGLTHPDIHWGALQHFDWEAHDRIVMSGGIASPKATMFASHAVISNDYMNLNLKFGYHFVIVDALCRKDAADNIVQFRFSGGGTEMQQRMLRAAFLKKVLKRLGFEVNVKSDLVDGQLQGEDLKACLKVIDMVGRLLGATPLLDMHLKDEHMVNRFVDDFMQGRYCFSKV